MFKKLFHSKQNEDPTLREKNLSVYQWGRTSAWAILIIGIILSYMASTWLSNLIQAIIYGFCNLFSFSSMINTVMSSLFSWSSLFENQGLLIKVPIAVFSTSGNMIVFFLRLILFVIGAIITVRLFMKVHVRYQNLNHHEQGDDRFATVAEVKNETNPIPDREYRYDIASGIPIMHEFNMRGRINNVVSHELFDLQQHFQLDPSHDPTGHAFAHFYARVKLILLIIFSLLVLWALPGFFSYNTSSSGGHVGFSSFWLFLILWGIIHFILQGILDAFEWVINLQLSVFSMPIAPMLLVLLIEVILLSIVGFRITRKIVNAYRYGALKVTIHKIKGTLLNLFSHKKSNKSNSNSKDNDDRKHGQLKTFYQEIKDPTNNISQIKENLSIENILPSQPRSPHDKKYWRYQALRSIFYPFIHGPHPFWQNPRGALRMAWLQFLSNVLPLDKGTTGEYYMTHGNGAMQNVLLYGITRSGKGQMIINTIIDINSRATSRFQKNMIFNDSKGELAAGESQILKERGYNVKVLNIMDPSHSMSYNPLADVIEQTKEGETGAAAKSCSILAGTIYNAKNAGSNKFFYDEAASLFDSIVFAIMSLAHSRYYGLDGFRTAKIDGKKYNIHEDGMASERKPNYAGKYYITTDKKGHKTVHGKMNAWSRVTIHNALSLITQLGGETAQENGGSAMDSSNQMIIYFEHITHRMENDVSKHKINNDIAEDQYNIMNQAVSEFEQSKIAGGGKTAGSIYTTFLNNLKIYQQPMIAKMTSKNSYHPEEMGFDRLLTVQFSRKFGLQKVHTVLYNSKLVNGKYQIGKQIETADSELSNIGIAKVPFDKPIPTQVFFVKMIIHDERANQSFPFILRCKKTYYDTTAYENIYKDFRKRPSVADLEIIEDDGKDANGDLDWKPMLWLKKSDNSSYALYYKKNKDKFNGDNKKLRVIDKYTKKPAFKKIATDVIDCPSNDSYANAEQSPIYDLRNIGNPKDVIRRTHFLYNPHPTALFLVTPPNASQLNQLCTFLINQTFNTLSTLSLHITKGRHVQRPLQFILDELGNIPAIPDMAKKLSIGLSQGCEFLLVFQNTEQITNNYGKTVGPSMVSNCSTILYILSQSEKTLDNISKACGNRTVITTGRNADPTKPVSANYNGNEQKQPVITPTQLRKLLPGEMVVIRSNDRSSVGGKSTKPTPLFDHGNNIMPFSFTFLKKYESSESLNAVPVVTPHKYLDLNKATIPFTQIYDWMEDTIEPLDKTHTKKKLSGVTDKITASGLSKDTQTILNNIVIDKENDSNADQKSQLGAVTYVEDMIPKLQRLQQGKTIADVSRYTLGVILHNSNKKHLQSQLPLLSGIMAKNQLQGNSLFDFIADEKATALDYVKTARKKMKAKLTPDKIKLIKDDIPFLFADKFGQVMGYLKLAIQDADLPEDGKVNLISPSKENILNESWLANSINFMFNDYLVRANIIKQSDIDGYVLTDNGKKVLKEANDEQALKQFIENKSISYEPDAGWNKVLSYGLNALKWVNNHEKDYNNYYGLAFAFSLCGLNAYHSFTKFTSIEDNKQYDLAIYPLVYISMVLPVYDSLLTHSSSIAGQNNEPRIKKTYRNIKLIERMLQEYYKHVDSEN